MNENIDFQLDELVKRYEEEGIDDEIGLSFPQDFHDWPEDFSY